MFLSKSNQTYFLRDHYIFLFESTIEEMLLPIKKNYNNIIFFDFVRIYKDGTFIALSNNSNATKYYYENENTIFLSDKINIEHNIEVHFFSSNVGRCDAINGLNKYFNIDNFLTIIERQTNYIDSFTYGARFNEIDIISTYFRDLEIFKKYMVFFKKKAKDLIQYAENKKMQKTWTFMRTRAKY